MPSLQMRSAGPALPAATPRQPGAAGGVGRQGGICSAHLDQRRAGECSRGCGCGAGSVQQVSQPPRRFRCGSTPPCPAGFRWLPGHPPRPAAKACGEGEQRGAMNEGAVARMQRACAAMQPRWHAPASPTAAAAGRAHRATNVHAPDSGKPPQRPTLRQQIRCYKMGWACGSVCKEPAGRRARWKASWRSKPEGAACSLRRACWSRVPPQLLPCSRLQANRGQLLPKQALPCVVRLHLESCTIDLLVHVDVRPLPVQCQTGSGHASTYTRRSRTQPPKGMPPPVLAPPLLVPSSHFTSWKGNRSRFVRIWPARGEGGLVVALVCGSAVAASVGRPSGSSRWALCALVLGKAGLGRRAAPRVRQSSHRFGRPGLGERGSLEGEQLLCVGRADRRCQPLRHRASAVRRAVLSAGAAGAAGLPGACWLACCWTTLPGHPR